MSSLVYLYLIVGLLLISYGANLLVTSTENISRSGEIFQVEIEEMDDTRKGDCEFTTARGTRFLYPDNSESYCI